MGSLLEQVEKVDDYKIKDGFGCVGKLMAGLHVKDRFGKVLFDEQWEAKSFNRNFGRLMQSIFEAITPALFTIQNNPQPIRMGPQGSDLTVQKLVARPNAFPSTGGGDSVAQGKQSGGAILAVGTGPLVGNDSTFVELQNKAAQVVANQGTTVIQEDGAGLVYVITQGITIVDSAGIDVTEIGLYSRFRAPNNFAGEASAVYQFLIAYDQINPAVHVPQGGVVSPKYTISWIA